MKIEELKECIRRYEEACVNSHNHDEIDFYLDDEKLEVEDVGAFRAGCGCIGNVTITLKKINNESSKKCENCIKEITADGHENFYLDYSASGFREENHYECKYCPECGHKIKGKEKE